jgi:hypothetical protein
VVVSVDMDHVHSSAVHALYIMAVVTILLVLPKTWAANHPDSDLSKAVLYIYG